MKKGLTIIETLIALVFGCIIFSWIYFMVSGGGFSTTEMFMPQQSKAKYQREILEELRRANDLKENE
jgi:hypothetical protein